LELLYYIASLLVDNSSFCSHTYYKVTVQPATVQVDAN